MRALLRPLFALFSGIVLLLLGNGLMNTLVTLAGEARGFSTVLLGLFSSGYFVGFFIGIFAAVPIIRRVGHVRTFAFMAALAAVVSLMLTLTDHPWLWLLLRVFYGVALVCLYAVIESWLNAAAPSDIRGRIFALYTILSLVAIAGGQQLLRLSGPEGLTLFIVVGILVSLALMPIAMTRLPQPDTLTVPRFRLQPILRAAPLALATAFVSGLLLGAFWGLMPLYGSQMSFTPAGIGMLMSASILGGAFGQLPIGYYSDRVDRRWVLMVVMILATVVSVLMIPFGESMVLWVLMALWGAAVFAIYPVAIAYMVDNIDTSEIISASSAILLIYGIGAAVGPAIAGMLMEGFGRGALPAFFAVILLSMVGVMLMSMRRKPVIAEEPTGHFSPMMRSTPQVLEMMPDAPEEPEELTSDQVSAVMPETLADDAQSEPMVERSEAALEAEAAAEAKTEASIDPNEKPA